MSSQTSRAYDHAQLPTLLSQACVRQLAVSGAGLDLLGSLRLPLGASDPTAALAEHAEATLGEGPCLSAPRLQDPVAVSEDTIARSWPMFHAEIVSKTPYRSVVSFPVMLGGQDAALDLYSDDPEAEDFPVHDDVAAVIAPITRLMAHSPIVQDRLGHHLPSWMVTEQVEARLDVWIAVGMIMDQHGQAAGDALALLRGYAYSHDRWLDHVAHDLLEGRIDAQDV